MTPERWQQVKEIFARAVEYGPTSREAFLQDVCANDEELKHEVETLLASDSGTGSLLDNPLMETRPMEVGGKTSELSGASALSELESESFGPYVPIRVLGEGGMGIVYLARQVHPIRREVALKVVKRGMDSRQVLERFEIERQALALMDYPHVARVLDAGTSRHGLPYFVMEYVDGVPITQYCDSRSLSTRARLELFVPVCNALQHAHKKGIIHRDVKPSNVLVTEVDGQPVPKVIDFGIARAIEQRSAELHAFTLAGQIIGTPEYMSPEQASLDCLDIDTGTDVYSLGVVLYELLVGALPLDVKSLRKAALGEVLRVLRETPAPRPTEKITQMGEAVTAVALLRNTSPVQLKRDLAGDLDWIVMKAIDKDRYCRYSSASEFAADIERYLKSEPVLAGPPGAAYRMRKFVARHKLPVAAAGAIALALLAGIVATTWEARVAEQERVIAEKERRRAVQHEAEAARERDAAQAASKRARAAQEAADRERDRAVSAERRAQRERSAAVAQEHRADSEAAAAKAVKDFLRNDVLAQAGATAQIDSGIEPDPDLKVCTALDRAAARIAGKFDAQPLVEASIRETKGVAYRNLGQYRSAQREFERVLELARGGLGERHPETIASMIQLGGVYTALLNYEQAEPLLINAVERSRRALGEENPITIEGMGMLGLMYQNQGKYRKAEELDVKSLELSRRVLGAENPQTIETTFLLGEVYTAQNKFTLAEPLLVKSVELSRRVSGESSDNAANAMVGLGKLYQNQPRRSLYLPRPCRFSVAIWARSIERRRRPWSIWEWCISSKGDMQKPSPC